MAGFGSHDHDACKASLLAAAVAVCDKRKLRLTPTRRRVLELLLDEHKALGAYDILKQLTTEGLGSQPVVVYRALDFLLAHGFAHKVETLNAFIACTHPLEEHVPAFMICKTCQSIAEIQLPFPQTILGEADQSKGFKIEKTIVEIEGICPNCIDTGAA